MPHKLPLGPVAARAWQEARGNTEEGAVCGGGMAGRVRADPAATFASQNCNPFSFKQSRAGTVAVSLFKELVCVHLHIYFELEQAVPLPYQCIL